MQIKKGPSSSKATDNVNVVSTESSPLKLQKTPGNDQIGKGESDPLLKAKVH